MVRGSSSRELLHRGRRLRGRTAGGGAMMGMWLRSFTQLLRRVVCRGGVVGSCAVGPSVISAFGVGLPRA